MFHALIWSSIIFTSITTLLRAAPQDHVLPLDSLRDPDGHVKEFLDHDLPSPEVFWRECVSAWTPCLLRGAGRHSPAYTQWNIGYMNATFGKTEIKREWRKENREIGFKWSDGNIYTQPPRILLEDFLADSKLQSKYYVVTIASDAMLADVTVPPCVLCGDRKKSNRKYRERGYAGAPDWLTQLEEADLWLSLQATKSLVHYDMDQVLNCLFQGEKEWKFYDTRKHYHKFPWAENLGKVDPYHIRSSNHLNIDVDRVNLKRYPKMADIPYTIARQFAGDCMFTPHTYAHQVNSFGDRFSAAISYHWLPDVAFAATVCDSAPRSTYISLRDFDYVWYYNGSGVIPLGYPDAGGTRKHIRLLIERAGKAGVSSKAFYQEFFKDLEGNSIGRKTKKERQALSRHHFQALDIAPPDGHITLEEANDAPLEIFVALSIAIDDGEEVNFRLPYHARPASAVSAALARVWKLDKQTNEL